MDELVYILLTVMTEHGVERVFAELKRRWPTWEDLLRARHGTLVRALWRIGLREQRAHRIRSLLAEIRRREGRISLRRLHRLTDTEIEDYLVSLPGVGLKVARCVMLYSFRRAVFPVDTHALRVLQRVGLADPQLNLRTAQDALQARVAPTLRYSLHVNLVRHGRSTCTARLPKCERCVLASMCRYAGVQRY